MAKALIIDDVEVSRYAIGLVLDELNVEYTEASDRGTTKTALANSPDVIFLDWHLKKESGLDLIAEIKKLSSAPIVVVSGVEEQSKAQQALQAGAAQFVRKPVDKDSVERVLKSSGVI